MHSIGIFGSYTLAAFAPPVVLLPVIGATRLYLQSIRNDQRQQRTRTTCGLLQVIKFSRYGKLLASLPKNIHLPSWVPDWSNLSPNYASTQTPSFSGPPVKTKGCTAGNQLLEIQGRFVDDLSEARTLLMGGNGHGGCLDGCLTSSKQREALHHALNRLEADIYRCSLLSYNSIERLVHDISIRMATTPFFSKQSGCRHNLQIIPCVSRAV
jgi:hypothetical protein